MRIDRLRNIGVLAHVDAGKTTLTERLLFAAGRIHRMGEVHDGESAMDHREVERLHGVTVSAAATRFTWDGVEIALLDTPGHVDFTLEVERALLAIDSAVVLFSAVAGVEPQTETVWAQADRAGLPRIAFINKMDAAGADFPAVLDAARKRLGARLAPVVWPVADPDDGADFGLIDLVRERWLSWPEAGVAGREADPRMLSPAVAAIPSGLAAEAAARREALVELAMEHGAPEEATLEAWLEGRAVDAETLTRLLRRACLNRALVPTLAGAAARGHGVTALLDAVAAFAPSPADRGAVAGRDPGDAEIRRPPSEDAPFAALVAKVAVTRFGPLATVRVLSGRMASGDKALLVRSGEIERIGRLQTPHAGGGETVEAAAAGEIVAVSGLKGAQSGDTLCDPMAPIAFAGLTAPEPVIAAAIEPVSARDQERLAPALAALTREDPSLRVSTDAETGALLLGGMGELHLQIALEALASERGVAARIGPPRIAYRETIAQPAEVDHTLKKQSGGPGQFARLTLRLEPMAGDGVVFENRTVGGAVPAAFVPAVQAAVRAAAAEGPLAGYPAQGLKAALLDGAHHAQDSSALAFANAARAAFREAYLAAAPLLLEPWARLEIRAPEAAIGAVTADLQARRGAVRAIEPLGAGAVCRIEGEAPLASLWGYVGALRSLTQGRGQAVVTPSGHRPALRPAPT